uniref:Uncharacterized protein n=1 Tax=Glossina austeni TaxID=7395 RepID=A0A1A9VCT4_GLOAU
MDVNNAKRPSKTRTFHENKRTLLYFTADGKFEVAGGQASKQATVLWRYFRHCHSNKLKFQKDLYVRTYVRTRSFISIYLSVRSPSWYDDRYKQPLNGAAANRHHHHHHHHHHHRHRHRHRHH